MTKGFKKYIRREKARIRRSSLDIAEKEEKIKKLYDNKRDIPTGDKKGD